MAKKIKTDVTPKEPEIVTKPAPKLLHTDYFIDYDQGYIDPGRTTMRAKVKEKKIFDDETFIISDVDIIGQQSIQHGFGVTRNDALSDLIRRNPANLLDKIFDVVVLR